MYYLDDETSCSTEAGRAIEVQICDIPKILQNNSCTYELRGIVNHRSGNTRTRSSIGHYNAYCKRNESRWEIMDDLKLKPTPIKENANVYCEYLVYTV